MIRWLINEWKDLLCRITGWRSRSWLYKQGYVIGVDLSAKIDDAAIYKEILRSEGKTASASRMALDLARTADVSATSPEPPE